MLKTDAAIAGAGLIGASIAMELARAGMSVAIFDRQTPGQEASWAGAGILSPAPENPGMIPLVELGKASLRRYPQFVATAEERSGINAGYRAHGTLEAHFSANAREELSTIIALHHGLGLEAEALSAEDARELEPALSPEIEAAILRTGEACVDNRLLTAAVVNAAKESGAQFFADCAVQSLWHDGARCLGFETQNGKVSAACSIIAAGSYSAQIGGAEHSAPVRPAKGQMISLRCPAVSFERVQWSDNIYLVPRSDGRILAGATVEYAGFNKDFTLGGMEKILQGALELAPGLREARIEETWAGLRPDTPDHLPILGPGEWDGLLFATGHFRSGILLAPITAHLIREWATGTTPGMDCERFSPLRFARSVSATGKHAATT